MDHEIKVFFDQQTSTLSYVIYDKESLDAIIIDPVLNFDFSSGRISFESINEIENFLLNQNLKAQAILETHVHADHLTGAYFLKDKFPKTKIVISENITKVQKTFSTLFNFQKFDCTGSQFDLLVKDSMSYFFGTIEVKAIATPGHTPACTSYLIKDVIFCGDTLFMPDAGTGRCDFPGADAGELYQSIQKIFSLPDSYQVYVGHDYQPNSRELRYVASVQKQKDENIHLNRHTRMEIFCRFRQDRDKTLQAPRLLYPSLQINIRAGRLPDTQGNSMRYLVHPIILENKN